MRRLLKSIAAITVVMGLLVSGYFFYRLSHNYNVFGDGPILLNDTSHVGNFIGGVVGTMFSFAGFLILVLTLNDQNKSTQKERFESKFFDLLRLHRENVKELEEGNNSSGRKELRDIFMEVLKCKEDLITVFSKRKIEQVYTQSYLQSFQQKLSQTNPDINLLELAKINTAYLITFYGVNADGRQTIKSLLEGKYKPQFIERILEFIAMKPRLESDYFPKWEKVMKLSSKSSRVNAFELIRRLRNSEKLDNGLSRELIQVVEENMYDSDYEKFYAGHQYKLGYYFRHLYQTFTFIDQQSLLNKEEKYFYAKILRAQLSSHEQALLFVNSLSMLGLAWDLCPVKETRLITRYNLIKNLPGEAIFGIVYKDFYPNVQYELTN